MQKLEIAMFTAIVLMVIGSAVIIGGISADMGFGVSFSTTGYFIVCGTLIGCVGAAIMMLSCWVELSIRDKT